MCAGMHEQAAAAIAHVGTAWPNIPDDLLRQALRIKAAVLLRAGNHRVRREMGAKTGSFAQGAVAALRNHTLT